MIDKKIELIVIDIDDNLQKLDDNIDLMFPGRPKDIDKKDWIKAYYLIDIKKKYKRIIKEIDIKLAGEISDTKPDLQVE